MKNFYIFILIPLILSTTILSAYDVKDESKYYFCSDRVFASDQRITLNEIDQICGRISNDYRILIVIQKDILVSSYSGNNDNYYTRDSEEFFNRQCNRLNRSICDYGFMISIYTTGRKVRIVAGKIAKNQVTIDDRNNIISNIKYNLSRERYAEGVIKAVDLLQSYSYYQPSYPAPNPNPNPTYIPPQTHKSSGSSFWVIFIFIICPIMLCCVYFMYRKQQEHSYYYTDTAEDVHNHLNKLEHLIKHIRKNSPPIKSISKCVLCMEKISCNVNQVNINAFSTNSNDFNNYNNNPQYNPQYNNSPLIQNDPYNTRFMCGHVYHNTCLSECRLSSCIMCLNDINSSGTIPNSHDHQVVDENQIRTLISNLHLIYDRDCLQNYATNYSNEFDNYNSTLALGLVSVWGVTAIATTAIMMSEMNHNPGYYNQEYYNQGNNEGYNSGYGNYSGNDNNYPSGVNDGGDPDTAGGDF